MKVSEWALCTIPSYGTKYAMLDGKRMQRPPKQSDWMSQCVACHPVSFMQRPIVLAKLSVVGFLRICKFLQID